MKFSSLCNLCFLKGKDWYLTIKTELIGVQYNPCNIQLYSIRTLLQKNVLLYGTLGLQGNASCLNYILLQVREGRMETPSCLGTAMMASGLYFSKRTSWITFNRGCHYFSLPSLLTIKMSCLKDHSLQPPTYIQKMNNLCLANVFLDVQKDSGAQGSTCEILSLWYRSNDWLSETEIVTVRPGILLLYKNQ